MDDSFDEARNDVVDGTHTGERPDASSSGGSLADETDIPTLAAALRRAVKAGARPQGPWWQSEGSALSITSKGSVLSIGSVGSVLSIGSVGSACSLFSVGSAGSVLSVGSFVSLLSAFSVGSRTSLVSALSQSAILARRASSPRGCG